MPNFASALFENEQQVREILFTMEALLREGDADEAALRLELAIEALEELGHPIAGLCHETPLNRVDVKGWEALHQRVQELNQNGAPITAVGIDISVHGDAVVRADGAIEPFLETNFYSDAAFDFTNGTRVDLIEGYSGSASAWQGCFVEIDSIVSIAGLGRLNAELRRLEAECRTGEHTDALDHDALWVGSAFLAVRVHQAMRECIIEWGLPFPMTVLVGSNESYPFFDAPVITRDEFSPDEMIDWADGAVNMVEENLPYAQTQSEGTAPWLEAADPEGDADADEHPDDVAAVADSQVSGSSLRKRLQANAPEPVDAAKAEESSGGFMRLFKRRA